MPLNIFSETNRTVPVNETVVSLQDEIQEGGVSVLETPDEIT